MSTKIAQIVFTLLLLTTVNALAQTERRLNTDPKRVRFITSDIDNFWRAYDLAAKESDRMRKIAIFKTEYLDKGSDGLRSFDKLRIQGAENLVRRIESMPKYYASIRESTLRIVTMKAQMLSSFKRLKRLYPDAVFPDVYFLIGRASSGGTTGSPGLLIGAEMYGLTEASPRQELGKWHLAVLKPVEDIPGIVAHELIHYEQDDGEARTLLERCLREGGADFVGQMISTKNINTRAYEYGNSNEKSLWEEFLPEMNTDNTAKWLYNGGNVTDRPADLGYYMGYKICESYYRNSRNKKKTISDILTIKNAVEFLRLSHYQDREIGSN